ncbi:hypothetical protein Esti_005819 [Eimeria stiedai]
MAFHEENPQKSFRRSQSLVYGCISEKKGFLCGVCAAASGVSAFVEISPVHFSYRYNLCSAQPKSCAPQSNQLSSFSADNSAVRRGFLRQRNPQDQKAFVLFAGEGSDELVEKVKAVVAEQLGADINKITPQSHFIKDLEADSLDSVELVMAFEEKFGVTIPDEEATKITTVQEAVDYIQKHKS